MESPVSTHRLSDLFGFTEGQYSKAQSSDNKSLFAGFRDCDTPSEFRIAWNTGRPASRLFALARLVGDHIDAPATDRLLPGTRSVTARQKFQRAFAQEFLCPFDDLTQYLGAGVPADDSIDDAAEHFGVSHRMIQTILVNKGVVSRDALLDSVY